MAWNIKGTMIEFCSCRALCPCWLGPDTKPDQGWCSGAIAYDISEGSVEGVDVAGCKAVLTAEWPGNFFGGKGKARLYLDSGAGAEFVVTATKVLNERVASDHDCRGPVTLQAAHRP